MKKIIKNNLLGFILGIILCSGIVYGVTLYKSEDIQYQPSDESWNVSNVGDALNALYNMKQELDNIKSLGDATANDIAKDKTAVINGELITGTAEEVIESNNFSESISKKLETGKADNLFVAPYNGKVTISGTANCGSNGIYSITLYTGAYSTVITQNDNVSSLSVSSSLSVVKRDIIKIKFTCSNNTGTGNLSGTYSYN